MILKPPIMMKSTESAPEIKTRNVATLSIKVAIESEFAPVALRESEQVLVYWHMSAGFPVGSVDCAKAKTGESDPLSKVNKIRDLIFVIILM
jgi:hypothetical protein